MLSKLFSLFKGDKENKPLIKITDHVLYHYSSCPFCFRVRIAMTQLGIEMEMRNIHQGDEHRLALQQGGGSTMVPCLRIEKNGKTEWMYESADIVRYLKQTFSDLNKE
jgi:glutathione S-transferase